MEQAQALFLFVWLGACMAMMFFMMGGMGGKGSDASGHSHGADLPKDFEDQARRRQ